MSDARAKVLIDLGDQLFSKRQPLLSLWQEIAENFYVERADFTTEMVMGQDFAAHLSDSYPLMLRRELGNHITSVLRPRDRPWFKMTTLDEARDADIQNSQYLEYAVRKLRSGIYHPQSRFIRATKEGDHDFVTFGQAVMSVEESADRTHPFFRSFHLRDSVWLEDASNEVNELHRKDRMTAKKMRQRFGENKLHATVKEACKKSPSREFNIRCIVMPTEEYDYVSVTGKGKGGKKLPFTIIYVDADNATILREGYLPEFPYVVPRWHTISGWQYAFSPATTIALPDARVAQALARIILESGEKAVDPPLVAIEEAVREVNISAGAITWADMSFDGKLREAVAPLDLKNDMRVAFEMRQDLREMLAKAWFIDKINLPSPEGQMTAYETARRLEEFVRNLLPLFEPMEIEYNTRLLDKSYALMRNMNAYDRDEVPEDLTGADVSWQFESPLQSSSQRMAVTQFQESLELIGQATALGVKTIPIDLDVSLKAALRGTQAPADWFRDDDELDAEAEDAAEQQAMMQQMQELQGGALVAKDVAEAGKAANEAMAPPELTGPGAEPLLLPAPQEAA